MHKDSLYVQCTNISYTEVYLSEVIGEEKYIWIVGVHRSCPDLWFLVHKQKNRIDGSSRNKTRTKILFFGVLPNFVDVSASMQLRCSEGHFESPKFLLLLEFHVPVYNVAT